MTDTYQLLTEKSVQEDEKAILQLLCDMLNGKLKSDLRLLNYYQEIPVSYPGIIEDIDDDMVDVTVHQHQAVVMHHQKFTFLKSRHFPHDVVARVFRANVEKEMALLHKFSYAHIRAERRQAIRVQVVDPLQVTFSAAAGKVTGNLVDISISGASIECPQLEPAIETQVEGVLSFALEGALLQGDAAVLKVGDHEGQTRYILCLKPSSKAEEKISQFIFQRQLEIIRALKEGV